MAKKQRVGIIGGGQLAMMLGEGAYELGLEPVAWAASSSDPGFRKCRGSFIATPNDAHAYQHFLHSVDVVAFENEFFGDDILTHAGALGLKFQPSLDAMNAVRNKLRQKELCGKFEIPTAPFKAMGASESPDTWVKAMMHEFGSDCVFKVALGGYDSKGVCLAEGESSAARCVSFVREAQSKNVSVFAEKKIAIRRELAIIAVRSTNGYSNTYPLVVVETKNGVCKLVQGPATALGISGHLEAQASMAAGKFGVNMNLSGVFALEFFEDTEGKLWLNEMAPRVHNTGHYTQEASETSQFENHWQAILGLAPGDTTTTVGAFAMLNLLGPDTEIQEVVPFELKLPEGVTYHDYDKKSSKPGRKMGHLNGVVDHPSELPAMVEQLKKIEMEWTVQMLRQAPQK